jgi:hypothetical protein
MAVGIVPQEPIQFGKKIEPQEASVVRYLALKLIP